MKEAWIRFMGRVTQQTVPNLDVMSSNLIPPIKI